MNRFLACLYAWVIAAYSSAALTTSRLMIWTGWAVRRAGYVIRPYDMLADRRRWSWRPRARCGWSSSSARTVRPRMAATTAVSTTTGTGGSPGPGSAGGDNLAIPMVPISEGPCRDLSRRPDRARTDVQEAVVQHNPCSARIDASSRKQFGMCDYPERKPR